jgi:hypothetical protein
MNTAYCGLLFSDERRSEKLYQWQLFVYSPRKSTPAFIKFARKYDRGRLCPLLDQSGDPDL